MPKRKGSGSREDDINHYRKKIKKLERKIRERQSSVCESASKSASEPEQDVFLLDEEYGADTPALLPDDWLLDWTESEVVHENSSNVPEPEPGPSTAPEVPPQEHTTVSDPNTAELDSEILEILGDDPSNTNTYGPEIRSELANRLLHVTQQGLSKELRKNLISKYLLPKNCAQIDAPKLNLEIKAAILDAAIKRDKGIETKQKQMSSAIACLSQIINSQLNSASKNSELLQKLMDVSRILCDLQHADSITRRNFILFALKSDMKEHLKNTHVDTFLFGENLPDTLRSARAVNKSGIELKADSNNKPAIRKGTATRPLNRKAPPQSRRPPVGTGPPAPRNREPAASRAPYPPPPTHQQPPHAHSSRTSSRPHPRRRY
uniref:Uncharacterized protein n=1 Tax=Heliothis virescens TaxID=7102 RepID=A0A2A4JKW9_HELVI